jgi:hypothetical protein
MDSTLELAEMKSVTRHAEIINDIGNNPSRNITCVPRKGDDPIGAKRVRVMAMAAGAAKVDTTDLAQTAVQFSAIERRVIAHVLCGEHELIAKGSGNRAPGFEQCFQVGFRRFLKAQNRFPTVSPMSVASRKNVRFGDPDAVLITPGLDFRELNDHCRMTIAVAKATVNETRHSSHLVIQDPF